MNRYSANFVRVSTISALVSLALAPAALLAGPAAADPVTVNFKCQAKPPIGAPQESTMPMQVTGTAPATASPGSAVAINLVAGQGQIPADQGGYKINYVRDLKLVAPFPTNSTYVSSSLTGGTVKATIDTSGGKAAIKVTDRLPGGSTFTLPALTVNVTAGNSGSITTTLAGTSYADPGLTMVVNAQAGPFAVNVPVSCYPDPAPIFTTTVIGSGKSSPTPQPVEPGSPGVFTLLPNLGLGQDR
ncbi:cyclase [Nocardia brasiliensis]|uniref:Putative cyclase-dehydratase n=1 Tax=Nocardia brasiliensis (strain ATCC 700358 / HUJEG-1) TaxID=1133849 RepID=K0F4Q8_NOCB7|nr:cyclase [Nocardia brasiliensis]AFU02521.1 putative cyclase-dehydratase [Nocardia brasiliensis ATCC 700358]